MIDQIFGDVTRQWLQDAAEALKEVGEFEEHEDGSRSYNGYGSIAIGIEEFLENPETQRFLEGDE